MMRVVMKSVVFGSDVGSLSEVFLCFKLNSMWNLTQNEFWGFGLTLFK